MTWDTRTWEPVSEATLSPPVARSTANHVLEASVGQDELMTIVNFAPGEIQRRYTDRFEADRKFLFSPNGQFLATSVAGCVSLWNIQPFEIRARFFGHTGWSHASALAWDHQSRFLATSGSDQVIRIWDAQNCKLSLTLTGLQGNPTKLEFSVDDSRLMSRGKEIRIWDVAQGREVISFDLASLGPDDKSFALSADDYKSMLSESKLNFENLKKANTIAWSDREVEQFEIEMLGHLAPIMTMNTQFPGHEPKDGLKIAFKAVDLAPENADLRMTLAVALLRNNRFEEAIRAAQARDRMTHADDGFSVLLQAIANWKLGHTELARKQLNRGIQMVPASLDSILDYRVIAKPVETGHRRSITVTTLNDELDGIEDGKISLREAILSADDGCVIEIHDVGTITLQYAQNTSS